MTGKKVSDTCKPCKAKAKIIKTGSGVLSYSAYQQYAKYLSWNGSGFDISEDLVAEKKETFSYYATTLQNRLNVIIFGINATDNH